jgi:hypothetical protein
MTFKRVQQHRFVITYSTGPRTPLPAGALAFVSGVRPQEAHFVWPQTTPPSVSFKATRRALN